MKRFAVSIFSVLCLLLAAASPEAAQRGISVTARSGESLYLYKDYHALVVGVGDYTAGWPDIPGAITDAREVAGALREMGVDVNVVLNPTSRDLRLALNKMAFSTGREKNRALLFYFAGHGETLELADGTKLGYIIPSDCPLKLNDPMGFDDKAVSMKDIELLALKVRSKHMLMMFDSCFSGSLFNLVRAAPVVISEKSARPVRQFITAGAAGEQVPDRSVFKLVFLQGVKGEADLNKDGFVTGSELGMHLQEKVVNYSRGGQHPQYGKINNPMLDKGDFIFALKGVAISRPGSPPDKAGPGRLDDDLRRREEELKRMEDLLRRQDEMLRKQREMEEKLRRKEEELERKQAALKKPQYTMPALPSNYISLFGATVTELQFFESGYNHPPKDERVYKTVFRSADTRYINWELNLSFSPPGRKINYDIHAKFLRADGSVYATQVHNAYVEADWTWSWHARGWGSKSGGTWPAGNYRVDLYVNGVKVASGAFEVI